MIWSNIITIPNRWMANYLKRRGWVVFYLEKEHRTCNAKCCWLQLYEEGEKP